MYIFNEKIKELRETLELTQDEMAKQLKIGVRAYIRYEKGERLPTIDVVYNVAKLGNVNYNWLFGNQKSMFIDDNNSSVVNVNNKNGNVAVNGTITISTDEYANSTEIRELLELLKDVPKSWVQNIIEKLKKSLDAIDGDFK